MKLALTGGSVAVGKLEGPGGPLSIIVPVGNGSVHVRAANGSSRPGFPVFLPLAGIGQGSSPALADMNGDGFTDIVVASSNGRAGAQSCRRKLVVLP